LEEKISMPQNEKEPIIGKTGHPLSWYADQEDPLGLLTTSFQKGDIPFMDYALLKGQLGGIMERRRTAQEQGGTGGIFSKIKDKLGIGAVAGGAGVAVAGLELQDFFEKVQNGDTIDFDAHVDPDIVLGLLRIKLDKNLFGVQDGTDDDEQQSIIITDAKSYGDEFLRILFQDKEIDETEIDGKEEYESGQLPPQRIVTSVHISGMDRDMLRAKGAGVVDQLKDFAGSIKDIESMGFEDILKTGLAALDGAGEVRDVTTLVPTVISIIAEVGRKEEQLRQEAVVAIRRANSDYHEQLQRATVCPSCGSSRSLQPEAHKCPGCGDDILPQVYTDAPERLAALRG
jgi:hypothetical protein